MKVLAMHMVPALSRAPGLVSDFHERYGFCSCCFSEIVLISREVGCDGRDGCARRAQLVRAAKSCGPGLSTLRSSSRQLLDGTRERWGQESPIPRESTKDTVKTNRAGKAGSSGWTCGTCRLHSLTQAGRRHQPMPGLPRALSFFRGTGLPHHPGAERRGENESCLLFRWERRGRKISWRSRDR